MAINIEYIIATIAMIVLTLYLTRNLWREWAVSILSIPAPEPLTLAGSNLHIHNQKLTDYQMGNLVSWLSSLGLSVTDYANDDYSVFVPDGHIVSIDRISNKVHGLSGVMVQPTNVDDNRSFIGFENEPLLTLTVEKQ